MRPSRQERREEGNTGIRFSADEDNINNNSNPNENTGWDKETLMEYGPINY
jgi:hypothetical protein